MTSRRIDDEAFAHGFGQTGGQIQLPDALDGTLFGAAAEQKAKFELRQQLFVGKSAFGKGFARHFKQNAVDFADQLVAVGRLKVKLSGHGLDD